MTQQHSPEPWEWIGGVPAITHRWNGKHVVLAEVVRPEWHEDSNKASEEAGANAARIVACVNACQGISNEELEAGVIASTIPFVEKLDEMRQIYLDARKSGDAYPQFVYLHLLENGFFSRFLEFCRSVKDQDNKKGNSLSDSPYLSGDSCMFGQGE